MRGSNITIVTSPSKDDIKVVTPHYGGAHAAANVRTGFSRYRAVGARLGVYERRAAAAVALTHDFAEELLQ